MKKMLAATVVIMMLISGGLFVMSERGDAVGDENVLLFGDSQNIPYVAHSLIHIIGDDDLQDMAWNESWAGDGSANNPYRIEGYEIDAGGESYGIWIENITYLYVEVVNCTIKNAKDFAANITAGTGLAGGAGIIFQNMRRGKIRNNNIADNDYGVFLNYSSNITVENNNISNNSYGLYISMGAGILFPDNQNILSNNISYNSQGIFLEEGKNDNITANTIYRNNYGIHIYESEYSNITNNSIFLNSNSGIYAEFNSNNIDMVGNDIYENNYGVTLSSATDNTLRENTIKNNSYGVYAYNSVNNIFHNDFLVNTYQAYDNLGGRNWDGGYPTGGNYWSDYNGTDVYSGPGQNLSGSDGIGDSPYTNIGGDSGALDNYPLIQPVKNTQQSFDIPIHLGWNLISYPLLASGDIEAVLNDDVVWDYAQWYDPTDSGDHWKTHVLARVSNDLNTIDNTMGIWLHITDAGDGYLTITGQTPNSTVIPLHAGWNLVSYPSSTLAAMSQAGLPAEVTKIAKYDSNTAYLVSEVTDWIGNNFVPGRGYWLYATADTTWTVNY